MRPQPAHDGISVQAYQVTRTSVHWHSDVLELVYVMRGTLDVRVSSERYLLEVGDFALMNAGDTHIFCGDGNGTDGGSLVVILQLHLADFAEQLPQLPTAIFACESFDLPRHLGTESQLRQQLLELFETPPPARRPLAEELLQDLLAHYGLEHYYDRRRALNEGRRAIFHQLVQAVRTHAAERDVLDLVSEQLHYSKGGISRITREASGMSFSELVTNTRLAGAEMRLIETDDTMAAIAKACGFSDVKYFTRAFRSWFGQTPAEYRKEHRADVLAGETVHASVVPSELLRAHRSGALPSNRPTRRSTTPIAVMTAESVPLDPAPFEPTPPMDRSALQPARPVPHLLPVRVARDEVRRKDWHDHVRHSDRRRFRPVVILEIDQEHQAEQVAGELVALAPACELWISYGQGQEEPAELLASALRNRYALDVTPVRLN